MAKTSDLELILTRYSNWESEVERDEYIDKLEALIASYNKAAQQGIEAVPDSIYDTCMDYLRELKPDSHLLHQLWSSDDPSVPFDQYVDRFLVQYPMLSIQTVKHLSDKAVQDFKSRLPVGSVEVVASVKENGHGVRIVWKNGYLEKATSRGRSTNGKDLTRQMKLVFGEFLDCLEGLGLVEVRGEALLPFSTLAEARKFNPDIKSAFSGVASMIRASATPSEISLLHVLCYDIFSDVIEFDTLSEKFQFLEDSGFYVPTYFTRNISRRTLEADLENIVNDMDLATSDYDYYTDGVVVAVNDLPLFMEFGAEDRIRLGNLALKIGRWRQDGYSGVVKEIKWVEGKSKKTPVAVLEDGVLTATGNTVTNVPLYAPVYILLLEAYPGNVIHFKYGGEAGVVPVTPDGRLVTELSLK